MICEHVPSKLLTRLEKIEQDLIEHFSLPLALENALLIGNSRQNRLLQSCCSQRRHLFCQDYPQSHSSINCFCVGQFDALPYAHETIDLIILAHVLEFSKHPKKIINEVSACLSKNGTLLLFSLSPINYLPTPKKNHAFSALSAQKTKLLLAQAGLEVKEMRSFFSIFSSFSDNKIMQSIDKIIAPYCSLLCNAYVIVAQKSAFTATPTPLRYYSGKKKFALALENSC